ncbi:MAG: hypothetical protein GTN39_01845 [Candidatus Aenigmarchaeota archaeon]|nr:hypothetical protein [Candidatus Aenigmarchaeota archaeon]
MGRKYTSDQVKEINEIREIQKKIDMCDLKNLEEVEDVLSGMEKYPEIFPEEIKLYKKEILYLRHVRDDSERERERLKGIST